MTWSRARTRRSTPASCRCSPADRAALGIEDIIGSAFDDTLRGDDTDNVVRAGAGDDVIDLRGGDDVADGGDGTDIADGGPGTDSCTVEYATACE